MLNLYIRIEIKQIKDKINGQINEMLFKFKKSILNHIGENGLWSRNGRYDNDENFDN